MNGKHTPGPWRVGIGCDGFVKTQSDAKLVASVYGDDPTCKPDDRMVANTRLIAAAPDLLDALKCARVHVARYLDEVGPCDHSVNICVCGIKETIDQVDAAIAKAEGEKETEAAP